MMCPNCDGDGHYIGDDDTYAVYWCEDCGAVWCSEWEPQCRVPGCSEEEL
jgi:ABC-type ATPase with predicted acetyltransferase domain